MQHLVDSDIVAKKNRLNTHKKGKQPRYKWPLFEHLTIVQFLFNSCNNFGNLPEPYNKYRFILDQDCKLLLKQTNDIPRQNAIKPHSKHASLTKYHCIGNFHIFPNSKGKYKNQHHVTTTMGSERGQ